MADSVHLGAETQELTIPYPVKRDELDDAVRIVVRALVLAALAATLGCEPAFADAQERACRTISMRLMQLQASGKADGGEARSVRSMLSSRGCGGGQRTARAEAKPRLIERPPLAARRAPASKPPPAAKQVATVRPAPAPKAARPKRAPEPAVAAAPKPERPKQAPEPVVATGPKGARPAAKPTPVLAKAARQEAEPKTAALTPRRSRPDREAKAPVRRKTFRTWCVRACDGYYFPISYSTTRNHFDTDEATCQAMCPAAETGLYFHDAGDGGPENMTSLAGQRYSELSAAFEYRTAVDRSCSCSAGARAPAPPMQSKAAETVELQPPLPPSPRPARGEDPETLANRAGRFDPGRALKAVATADGSLGQSVRVVWPDWQAEQSEVMISAVPGY